MASITALKAKRTLLRQKRNRVKARIKKSKNRTKKEIELTEKRKKLVAKYNSQISELNKQIEKSVNTHRPATVFSISSNGLNLIKEFEGFVPTTEDDGFGNPTVGYGHVVSYRADSAAVKAAKLKAFEAKYGKRLTVSEAAALLKADLAAKYELAVRSAVKVPLTQNQYDAIVSASYNVGTGFVEGTTFIKKLNNGDYKGAADEFLRWDMANGKHVPGLTRRRKAERELFLRK